MTKDELLATLGSLNWSQARLARKLSVHVNTVSAWATGVTVVPGYVIECLRMAELAKEILK